MRIEEKEFDRLMIADRLSTIENKLDALINSQVYNADIVNKIEHTLLFSAETHLHLVNSARILLDKPTREFFEEFTDLTGIPARRAETAPPES